MYILKFSNGKFFGKGDKKAIEEIYNVFLENGIKLKKERKSKCLYKN